MMAEAQRDDDDIIFVYMGGDQQVLGGVDRARIHQDVKIVRSNAFPFQYRYHLISVEFHDGVEIVEEEAFKCCVSLMGGIKLRGVKIIKAHAFCDCKSITDVEFGDKLETIEQYVFSSCIGLEKIRIPSVRTIGKRAFSYCRELTDVEFGEGLMTLHEGAFCGCSKLKRISLPLKGGMIEDNVFLYCSKLETVDLVGGIHQTVASLHLESWRNEMTDEINRINQTLPTAYYFCKTPQIRQWMVSVINLLDHYKAEHHNILKEATTLLELALWKANLDENEGDEVAKEQWQRARKELRVTSGADIVIKNVLPFLKLK